MKPLLRFQWNENGGFWKRIVWTWPVSPERSVCDWSRKVSYWWRQSAQNSGIASNWCSSFSSRNAAVNSRVTLSAILNLFCTWADYEQIDVISMGVFAGDSHNSGQKLFDQTIRLCLHYTIRHSVSYIFKLPPTNKKKSKKETCRFRKPFSCFPNSRYFACHYLRVDKIIYRTYWKRLLTSAFNFINETRELHRAQQN